VATGNHQVYWDVRIVIRIMQQKRKKIMIEMLKKQLRAKNGGKLVTSVELG